MFKQFYFLLFMACFLSFQSCIKQDDFFIEEEQVNHILISSNLHSMPIELNKKESKKLISLLNKSSEMGITKYSPEYWISIHLKNDSIIKIKTQKNNFKINRGDMTYSIRENNYFSDLWNKKFHGL